MYLSINNEKIHYNKLGNNEAKKTILFIHGSAMSGKLMEDVAVHLPQYNNITIDLPGHVHSEGEAITSPELLADFMVELISELRKKGEITDDLTLAGYSLGGCVTLELALRQTPGIKRVAVLNACDFKNAEVRKLYTPVFEEFSYLDLAKMAYGRNSVPAETSGYFLEHKASPEATYVDVMGAVGYAMKDFEKISIPTIFIAGGEDRVAPLKNITEISQMVPNAVLSVIPFHGHMSILEKPEIYAENIHDLIRHNA